MSESYDDISITTSDGDSDIENVEEYMDYINDIISNKTNIILAHRNERAHTLKNNVDKFIKTSANTEYEIAKNLYENCNYIVVRDNNVCYTVGLWYYYGLPELILDDTDTTIHTISEYIKMNVDLTLEQIENFNNGNYDYEIYDKLNTQNYALTQIDEKEYIDYGGMLTFYSYFVTADKKSLYMMTEDESTKFNDKFNETYGTVHEDGLDYQLYPVCRLD
jgi:hypothetical protein